MSVDERAKLMVIIPTERNAQLCRARNVVSRMLAFGNRELKSQVQQHMWSSGHDRQNGQAIKREVNPVGIEAETHDPTKL